MWYVLIKMESFVPVFFHQKRGSVTYQLKSSVKFIGGRFPFLTPSGRGSENVSTFRRDIFSKNGGKRVTRLDSQSLGRTWLPETTAGCARILLLRFFFISDANMWFLDSPVLVVLDLWKCLYFSLIHDLSLANQERQFHLGSHLRRASNREKTVSWTT